MSYRTASAKTQVAFLSYLALPVPWGEEPTRLPSPLSKGAPLPPPPALATLPHGALASLMPDGLSILKAWQVCQGHFFLTPVWELHYLCNAKAVCETHLLPSSVWGDTEEFVSPSNSLE